ncbi:MAG: hypothetical protein ABL982_24355 [Vicinamibacterales bacterium]
MDAAIVSGADETMKRTIVNLRSRRPSATGFVVYTNSDCTALTAGITSTPLSAPDAVNPAQWSVAPENLDDFTALGEALSERARRVADVPAHVHWCFSILGDALKQLRASDALPSDGLILIDDFDPSDRTEALTKRYAEELNSPTTFARWHQALWPNAQ